MDNKVSIVINGIKMPKAPDEMIELAILGDGTVIQTGESWRNPEDGKCYYTVTNPEKFGSAVSVPPHGDLIDRDALLKGDGRYIISFGKEGIDVAEIERAPTVISKEEDE